MNLDEKFRQYKLNTYLPEEETMQRPEALPSPDIVSQLVTEGVSSVVSDIEKMPAQSLYALGKGAIEGAVGTPGDLISIIKVVAKFSFNLFSACFENLKTIIYFLFAHFQLLKFFLFHLFLFC